MAVAYASSGSAAPGEVNDLSIASVVASAGDTIIYAVFHRYSAAAPTITTPTWNSENFSASFTRVAVGPGASAEQYLSVFQLTAASSGTYTIVSSFAASEYRRATVGYAVFTGVSSIGTWSTEEEWEASGYTNPSLAIGSMAADDMIVEVLGASNWDEGYADMSAVTWAPANSQTERQDVADSGTGGHLVIATHTGTGSVTVGYTPSANQPGFAHAAVRLVGAGGGSSQAPRSHNQHSRRRAA